MLGGVGGWRVEYSINCFSDNISSWEARIHCLESTDHRCNRGTCVDSGSRTLKLTQPKSESDFCRPWRGVSVLGDFQISYSSIEEVKNGKSVQLREKKSFAKTWNLSRLTESSYTNSFGTKRKSQRNINIIRCLIRVDKKVISVNHVHPK